MPKNFLFIGGDQRQLYAAENIATKGHKVFYLGFGKKDNFSYSDIYDCIILPAPFTKDNKSIYAPLSDREIHFSELENFNTPALLIGGGFKNFTFPCKKIDLLLSDEYNILNATASAEGAICLAIQNTFHNIKGSNILICGYGKIGKCLSNALLGFGANIFIAARKEADRAYIKVNNFTPLNYNELISYANKFDIIFNTVPSLVINKEIINHLNNQCLILDLASMPGGTDFSEAQKNGIKAIHTLGLPGKYSPKSSGEILSGIILKLTGDNL